MDKTEVIKALKQFGLDNWETSKGYSYECYDAGDWLKMLEATDFNLEAAKRNLRARWELTLMQERECQF